MSAPGEGWLEVCATDAVEPEDVIRVSAAGRPLAIYRSPEDTFHATDALCTHERAELADGLVMGSVIECPKHNGRFDYRTGEATRLPARLPLCVHPVQVAGGRVYVRINDRPVSG